MTLPNLVIAGAPKCGTTSLFEWLSDHPDVCGASVKETKYLLDRNWYSFNRKANVHDHGMAGYARHFRHCDPASTKVVLEATPGYLYQDTAPRVLSALNPPPRILFILREPSARVYSAYQWARHTLRELDHRATFRDYVDLLRSPDSNRLNDAVERSQYVDYLAKWLELFDRSRVEILLFEDLRHDKRAFMRDVAGRVGIDPTYYDGYGFPYKNATQEVKALRVHRAMLRVATRLAPDLVQPGRGKEELPSRLLRRALGSVYAAVNVRRGAPPKTSDDEEVLAQLHRHYAPYNDRLSDLAHIDLAAWEPRGGTAKLYHHPPAPEHDVGQGTGAQPLS